MEAQSTNAPLPTSCLMHALDWATNPVANV